MLGIAKLLLLMGPVKRETPYVVSLAMTGLVRGYNLNFHIKYEETAADDAMSVAGRSVGDNGKPIPAC